MEVYGRILVAVDGTRACDAVLHQAVRLAFELGVELYVITVGTGSSAGGDRHGGRGAAERTTSISRRSSITSGQWLRRPAYG